MLDRKALTEQQAPALKCFWRKRWQLVCVTYKRYHEIRDHICNKSCIKAMASLPTNWSAFNQTFFGSFHTNFGDIKSWPDKNSWTSKISLYRRLTFGSWQQAQWCLRVDVISKWVQGNIKMISIYIYDTIEYNTILYYKLNNTYNIIYMYVVFNRFI